MNAVNESNERDLPMTSQETAMRPEDITRLFVERSNAGDADGVAALYEENAVMAYPPGKQTVGRTAIRDLWASVLEHAPHFLPGWAGRKLLL